MRRDEEETFGINLCGNSDNRSIRGYNSARNYNNNTASNTNTNIGWRPALKRILRLHRSWFARRVLRHSRLEGRFIPSLEKSVKTRTNAAYATGVFKGICPSCSKGETRLCRKNYI